MDTSTAKTDRSVGGSASPTVPLRTEDRSTGGSASPVVPVRTMDPLVLDEIVQSTTSCNNPEVTLIDKVKPRPSSITGPDNIEAAISSLLPNIEGVVARKALNK